MNGKRLVVTAHARELAEATSGYSRDRWGESEWARAAAYLLRLGRSDAEVVVFLQSKHMRWAADHVDGAPTVECLDAYVLALPGGLVAEVNALMAEDAGDERVAAAMRRNAGAEARGRKYTLTAGEVVSIVAALRSAALPPIGVPTPTPESVALEVLADRLKRELEAGVEHYAYNAAGRRVRVTVPQD